MKNKRGQFYLIAALLIVIAVSSITTVSNFAIANPTPRIIDYSSFDLNQEGSRIIDYGIYSQKDVNQVLNNFASKDFAPYFLKQTENSNIVFIYGNKTNLYAVQYNLASKGTITSTIGGSTSSWDTLGQYAQNLSITPSGNTVNVNILGKNIPFTLQSNTMFYFVIVHQNEGEVYVQKNN